MDMKINSTPRLELMACRPSAKPADPLPAARRCKNSCGRRAMRIQKNASRPSARNIPGKSPLIIKAGPRVRAARPFQVDMMAMAPVQALAPVLPPMARARTAYVVPGTRFVNTIRRACVEMHASTHVLPPSVLVCT